MDRSADFVQLLSQFVQQIEGGMDSGLRTWANETIRERLEAVEKDLLGRSRRLKYTCGPKG